MFASSSSSSSRKLLSLLALKPLSPLSHRDLRSIAIMPYSRRQQEQKANPNRASHSSSSTDARIGAVSESVTAAAATGETWKLNAYTTSAAATAAAPVAAPVKETPELSKAFEEFNVDNSTFSQAQIRATFYPKFENEKSDQEASY